MASSEDTDLTLLGTLEAPAFELLYNNHIRFDQAEFFSSNAEVYGGTARKHSQPVFIHIFVDEFDDTLVEEITLDDEDYLELRLSDLFLENLRWLVGELLGEESNDEIAKVADGKWGIPSLLIVHVYCPHPETLEEVLAWTARIDPSKFTQHDVNKSDWLDAFFEEARESYETFSEIASRSDGI